MNDESTQKRIRKLYKRINKKLISNKVHEFHKLNGTAPKQLNVYQFPVPFLPHDIIFMESYNNLIKKFQNEIIDLCIKRCNDQIKKLEDDLARLKSQVNNNNNNIDEIFNNIKKEVEDSFKMKTQKALDKAAKLIVRSLNVKERNDNDSSIDENWYDEPNETPQNNHQSRRDLSSNYRDNNLNQSNSFRHSSRHRPNSNQSRNRFNSRNYPSYNFQNQRHNGNNFNRYNNNNQNSYYNQSERSNSRNNNFSRYNNYSRRSRQD